MNEIVTVKNYDNLSMNSLLIMLKGFSGVLFEDKKPVFSAIIKKYFEDKSSVNLYRLLWHNLKVSKIEERLSCILYVLGRELEGDINDLPMEYREDFLKIFIYFLDTTEHYLKQQDSEIQWALSNMPKLIDCLVEIEKADIDSYSLRNRINELIAKVREDFEKKKNEYESSNTPSVALVNITLPVQDIETKLNQIKTLKLKKSKLNKSNLADALTTFDLYSDEDKAYLVNYMFKHHWEDSVKSIDPVVAFDYFRRNITYTNLSDKFNPFKILMGSFIKLQHSFTETRLRAWKKYFNASTVEEMMQGIEKWYKSYDGATDLGWKCYRDSLFSYYFTDSYAHFRDRNELVVYGKQILFAECEKYLRFFIPYKNKNLKEWLKKVTFIEEYRCIDSPKIVCDRMVESVESVKEEDYLISYYYKIFERYNNRMFEYYGGFIESSEIDFDIDELKDLFEDYITVLNTLTFTGKDLVDLKNDTTIPWSYYGGLSRTRKVKNDVMSAIQRFFCQNYKSLTKDFIRDLWFDEEHYNAFLFFTDYKNNSGLFKDHNGYTEFFFKVLESDMEFSNVEDLKKFFRLKGAYHRKGQFFNRFYAKLKTDCPECYKVIDGFINGRTEGVEADIVKFVKSYYDLDIGEVI